MGRLSLYLVGIYGLAAAYLVYLDRHARVQDANAARGASREAHIPAGQAAEMLRQAWADHHTVA